MLVICVKEMYIFYKRKYTKQTQSLEAEVLSLLIASAYAA